MGAHTCAMKTFNLYRGATSADESDPPGFGARSAQLGPMLGAARLGMTVYELPAGQSICPYHFHWGDEEWLIVLRERPRFGLLKARLLWNRATSLASR